VRNTAIFNSTTSDIFGGEIHSSYESRLGTTGLGVSVQETKFRSLKLDTTNRTQTALFAEHRFHFLNNRLDITPGVMYSRFSDFGGDFFPGVDVGFRANEYFKLYASWGKTFRIPTFTDLYFNNSSNANNPNLQPEKAQNVELGLKYNASGWRINASWFMRDGKDIIDRVKTDTITPGVKWFPTNLASLKVAGIELGIDYLPTILWGGDFWLQRISFSTTYLSKVAYGKSNEVKVSRYAADQLKWQANFSVQSKIFSRLSQSINIRYFERIVLPKGYEEQYKGFLTDWRLTWSEKHFRVIAQANNIFNKKYVESNGITMPRRWISIGLETQLGQY
jgi:vitamin B12 transporter